MEVLAILFAVTSAVLHALRNLFVKNAIDKQIFAWLGLLVGLSIYVPLTIYVLPENGIPVDEILLYGTLTAIIHFLYMIFYTKAYEEGDFSHVYPIMRSAPALVMLLAILFLNELVSWQGAIGIGLVVLGAYVINMKGLSASSFFEPILSLRERPVRFAGLTMIAVSGYSIVDKMAVATINPIVYITFYQALTFLMFGAYLAICRRPGAVGTEWHYRKLPLILNGVFGLTSYVLILFAFQMERVSYIVGLRQISVVVAVILGGQLLGEGFQRIRLVASILIFGGAMLISSAP